ncbi:unnamed protein product [Microthlaspi erraticum]|uniref:Uncharacterized protein n=1 Tax=Microthlaspi erraticum TaxID=1685480 RepID=A0A6D2IYD2_9BRAS|nr:unnamed protein product [Microthlaspi erraticum]
MGPPNDELVTKTSGLQSQLGADGNPIVHPVEVDATNGHVNPPPPPVPDVEAPVTTAALTAAMQSFAAQIAEMQAQQQKYNDKIDSLHVTSDGRVSPTGRTLFQHRQEAPPRLVLMPRRMVRKTPTRKWPSCAATSTQSAPKCTTPSARHPRLPKSSPRRKESFHSSHRRDTSKGSNGSPSSVLQQW